MSSRKTRRSTAIWSTVPGTDSWSAPTTSRWTLPATSIDGPGGPFIFVAGVANRAGHDRVTVTGGTITGYFLAVEMWKTQGGAVTHVDTPGGIFLRNSPGVRIEKNRATSIDVFGESHHVAIARNRIASRSPDVAGGPGGAIALHGGFPDSPPPAFPDEATGSPEGVIVDRNELLVIGFGGGIKVANAPRAVVTRNTVTATDPGQFDTGIHVQETVAGVTAAALVEHNDVSGTTNGIRLIGATDTVVIRNTVSNIVEDGILAVNAQQAQIDRNRVERSGDDGIDVAVTPVHHHPQHGQFQR